MVFKKIDYDSGEEIFDLKIVGGLDNGRWKCMKSDFYKILRIINDKYNLNLIIKRKSDIDISWAK